jgi:hypothetical protein
MNINMNSEFLISHRPAMLKLGKGDMRSPHMNSPSFRESSTEVMTMHCSQEGANFDVLV